jgi:hypothetical protein
MSDADKNRSLARPDEEIVMWLAGGAQPGSSRRAVHTRVAVVVGLTGVVVTVVAALAELGLL